MLPQLGVRGIVILDRRGIRGIFGTRRRREELGEQEGRRGSGICGGHVGRGSLGRATDQRLQDAPGAHSGRHRKMSLCGRNGWTREFKCEVGVGLLDPTTTTEDAVRSFSSTRLRRDKQRARWSGSSREAIESSPPPPPPPPARCRNRSSAGHRVLGCRTGNTPGERSTLVQSAARATARDSITKRPLANGQWPLAAVCHRPLADATDHRRGLAGDAHPSLACSRSAQSLCNGHCRVEHSKASSALGRGGHGRGLRTFRISGKKFPVGCRAGARKRDARMGNGSWEMARGKWERHPRTETRAGGRALREEGDDDEPGGDGASAASQGW